MQEINCQVQTTIQAALSQYLPPKTEAETSSKHKRKIAELEAQLHEAEDVTTDIRSELIRSTVKTSAATKWTKVLEFLLWEGRML
ncbi:hypothetical protein E2542_SST30301 [Spatholobus suberectus]|nr:hypothetical protein E2542_SST30301 [Spatholobus suberectus]